VARAHLSATRKLLFVLNLDYLHPSWQLSATLSALLTVVAVALTLSPIRQDRRVVVVRSFAREFAIVMALLGLWQYVGRFVRIHSLGAMHRALEVQSLQNWLHLPDQLALQQFFLPFSWLIRGMNVYYAFAHLNGMAAFLIWVWWRRRGSFHTVRNTVVGSTLICLLVQAIPVAPPRLLTGGGYVDTGLAYGQSVYGQYATGLASQLTAMPSVHVEWAFIVAWYVATLGRGPLRWLGCVHLVTTVMVVVVTANHWWLDGAVAILITLAVLGVQKLLPRPQPVQGDRDQAPDRALGGQGSGGTESVQAVSGQLVGRDVAAERARPGRFGEQVADEVM
jgi:PAP2 superfamily